MPYLDLSHLLSSLHSLNDQDIPNWILLLLLLFPCFLLQIEAAKNSYSTILSEVHAACCVLGGEGELPRRDSHPEPRNCSVAQACTVPGPTYRLAPRYAEKIVRSSSTSSPRSNRARELGFAAVLLCSHKYSQISAQIHMHINKK